MDLFDGIGHSITIELTVDLFHNAEVKAKLRDSGDQAESATVEFRYLDSGLERFDHAFKYFRVGEMFANVLPPGSHRIDVGFRELEGTRLFEMHDASTIWVDQENLSKEKSNWIGSSIGHELNHFKDYLRGDITDRPSANASEWRAYGWQLRTADKFNLDMPQRVNILMLRATY